VNSNLENNSTNTMHNEILGNHQINLNRARKRVFPVISRVQSKRTVDNNNQSNLLSSKIYKRASFAALARHQITHVPESGLPKSSSSSSSSLLPDRDQILIFSVQFPNLPSSGEDNHILFIGLSSAFGSRNTIDYPELWTPCLQKYLDKVNLHPAAVHLSCSKIFQLVEPLVGFGMEGSKSYGKLSAGIKNINNEIGLEAEGELFLILDVDGKKRKENNKLIKELKKICGREMSWKQWVGMGMENMKNKKELERKLKKFNGSDGWVIPRKGIFGALRMVESMEELKKFAMIEEKEERVGRRPLSGGFLDLRKGGSGNALRTKVQTSLVDVKGKKEETTVIAIDHGWKGLDEQGNRSSF